ncbi:MAG: phenylalanine--tRNA ligase subunit beta [Myxococcota bacterium]
MKISVDWLSDFVDLSGIPPERLAEELTVRTAEVEGWEIVRRSVAGLLIVEVVRAEPIGDGGRTLHAVTVDAGGRRYETVCAAPNVRVGMKAAFAPAGAKLANVTVAAATVHGFPSEGMLCSPAEIGMGSAKDGLLECPADIDNGTPLEEHVPAEDMLIEIDNKSLTHRPDLWGHYGFAREFASIFERPLQPFDTADLAAYDALPDYPVSVEDATDCPVYSALAMHVTKNPASPLKIQRRLLALGSTPINALVDVTNYVQLELGQPTHAFDARNIGKVRVGRAGANTTFTTLDGKGWKLQPDDLLIYDDATPAALAGIMGGHGSQVQPDTRAILIESANFRAARIRTTSVRLALRTDASLRFEKKLPPVFTRLATGRIVRHLADWGLSPEATSRWTAVGDLKDEPRTIRIPAGWLTKRAGVDVPNTLAKKILGSVGFGVDEAPDGGLTVAVPPFRGLFDIAIPEDISEEVFRLYGYDNIAATPPKSTLHSVLPHVPTRNHHRMRRVLSQAHGYVEVQTYSWYADDWNQALGYTPTDTVDIRNPIAVARRHMRTTLVPNVLAVANQNRKVRSAFRVYEIGKVFSLVDGRKHEENHLAGVSVDQGGDRPVETHLRSVRGALDDLATVTGLGAFTYVPVSAATPHPWCKPGTALEIRVGDTLVGHVGVLPAALRPRVLDGGHAVWFSLRTGPIEGDLYPAVPYTAPPAFPGSWQDFTFVWPVGQGYAALDALLAGFSHPVVTGREFVTVYRAKGSDTANYTFRFVMRLADRTLGTEDIESFRAAFLAFKEQAGLKLV